MAALWSAVWVTIAATYALWVLYLAAMNLRRAREAGRLFRVTAVLAMPVIGVAVAIDVLLNLVLGTLVFLDRPREWTVSARLERYLPGHDWRAPLAFWVAEHLLDPFDPSGTHLRR